MPKKPTISEGDAQLLAQLQAHPELKERIRAILQLAECGAGPLRTADEIEGLLGAAVRGLGQQTMQAWAQSVQARVEAEVPQQYPGSYRSKKKR